MQQPRNSSDGVYRHDYVPARSILFYSLFQSGQVRSAIFLGVVDFFALFEASVGEDRRI